MISFIDFDKQTNEFYFNDDIEIIHPQKVKSFLNKIKSNTSKGKKNKIKKKVEERKKYIEHVSKEKLESKEKIVSREEQRINRQIFIMTQNDGEISVQVKPKVGVKSLFKLNKTYGFDQYTLKELLQIQKKDTHNLKLNLENLKVGEIPSFLIQRNSNETQDFTNILTQNN